MKIAVRRVKNIDWTDLNNRTRSYSFEQCAPEEEDAVFCALHLKMSEDCAKVNAVTAASKDEIPFISSLPTLLCWTRSNCLSLLSPSWPVVFR
jgi:hypothetical protein